MNKTNIVFKILAERSSIFLFIIFAFTIIFPIKTEAANYYFHEASSPDRRWDIVSNWWLDDDFTIQATTTPGVEDDVFVDTDLTLNLDPYGLSVKSVVVGVSTSTKFNLSVRVSNGITFYKQSESIYTTINGNATYNEGSKSSSYIYGSALFNDTSHSKGGFIYGTSTYSRASSGHIDIPEGTAWSHDTSDSYPEVGIDNIPITLFDFTGGDNYSRIDGNPNFYGNSVSYFPIYGNPNFYNSSYSVGNIYGNPTFRNNSFVAGEILGNPAFYDASYAVSNLITGNPVFCDNSVSSSNIKGSVIGNDSSKIDGNIVGNVILNGTSSSGAIISSNLTLNTEYYSGFLPLGNELIINGKAWAASVDGNIFDSTGLTKIDTVIFNGTSRNDSSLKENAFFNDDSYNNSLITGDVKFNSTYYSSSTPINGELYLENNSWYGRVEGNLVGPDDVPITKFFAINNSCIEGYIRGDVYASTTCLQIIGDEIVFGAPYNDYYYGSVDGDIYDLNTLIKVNSFIFNGLSINNGGEIYVRAEFNDQSNNSGTLKTDSYFNDGSYNSGILEGKTIFNTIYYNNSLPIGDKLVISNNVVWNGESPLGIFDSTGITEIREIEFRGDSINNSVGNLIYKYYGYSTSYGTTTGNPEYFDYSASYGVVYGNPIFRQSAHLDGLVYGNPRFYDDSSLSSGVINGNPEFYNYSSSQFGSINGNAVFNDYSTLSWTTNIGDLILNDEAYAFWSTIDGSVISDDYSYLDEYSEVSGDATCVGENSCRSIFIGGNTTRKYNQDTWSYLDLTERPYVSIIADGSNVNLYHAVYSSSTNFVTQNGGSFVFERDPNVFWWNGGVDNNWFTINGNWWKDEGHTTPLGRIPTFYDDVKILGDNGPIHFGTSTPEFYSLESSFATTTLVGVEPYELTFGEIIGNIVFKEDITNYMDIIGNPYFDDRTINNLKITGNPTFASSSINNGEIIGNATFLDSSQNNSTTTGTSTYVGDTSTTIGFDAFKVRKYLNDIVTVLDFVQEGPWTVVADGATVDIRGSMYDSDKNSSTYTTLNTMHGGKIITREGIYESSKIEAPVVVPQGNKSSSSGSSVIKIPVVVVEKMDRVALEKKLKELIFELQNLLKNNSVDATSITKQPPSNPEYTDSKKFNIEKGTLKRVVKQGQTSVDAKLLQKYLNSNGYRIASSGPGSPGSETDYFGNATRRALTKFQKDKKIKQTGILDTDTIRIIEK